MTVIKEFILRNEIKSLAERIERLKNISAPKIMIEGAEKQLKQMEDKGIKIGGDQDLLNVEYVKHEVKKGRGGKHYLLINDEIKYYPEARYGKFISK